MTPKMVVELRPSAERILHDEYSFLAAQDFNSKRGGLRTIGLV